MGHLITLLLITLTLSTSSSSAGPTAITTEAEALLRFKEQVLHDPQQILKGWSSSDASSLCLWSGVTCNGDGRVHSLSLSSYGLSGALQLHFPWIPSLPFLHSLDLSANQFTTNLTYPASSSTATSSSSESTANNAFHSINLSYLNLSHNLLSGSFLFTPASFFANCSANSPNLQTLDFSHNAISDSIPGENTDSEAAAGAGIFSCPSLLYLDLSSNNISGTFPDRVFSMNCRNLTFLDISSNRVAGSIPSSLRNCINLISLNLTSNLFMSALPDLLADFPSLQKLYLSNNQFTGEISPNLFAGNLCVSLQELDLSRNNLSGSLPPTLSRCNNLRKLKIDHNKLGGNFSAIISPINSGLPSLEIVQAAFNGFSGPLPINLIGSCPRLRILDLGANSLSGSISDMNFCSPNSNYNALLTYPLEELLLPNNRLSGSIPQSVGNCSRLIVLNLSFNNLTGSIPAELGHLLNLQTLSLWQNKLTGAIPGELGSIARLKSLVLNNNLLSGRIPAEISGCSDMEWLNLNNNQLSGEIPAELGQMQRLTLLLLGNNSLSGEIPAELGNCSQLLWVDLNSNQLTGSIPGEVGRHSASSLQKPVLSGYELAYVRNPSSACRGLGLGIMVDFTGLTPEALLSGWSPLGNACGDGVHPVVYVGGSLYDNPENRTLQYLDLSYNQLSGALPEEMGTWVSLISLALSHNQLTGPLPESFRELRTLGVLDISYNHLEGSLAVLAACTLLVAVDVSNNYFSGEIPSGGQLSTNPSWVFANNSGLCGLPLPPCGGGGGGGDLALACKNSGDPRCASSAASRDRLRVISMMTNSIVVSVLVALLCSSALLGWFILHKKRQKERRKAMESALLSSLQQASSSRSRSRSRSSSSAGGGGTGWNLSGEKEPLSINVATFERALKKLTFSQLIEATNGFSRESLVGSGGFGEVYRAGLKDGTVVAIKKLVQFSCQGEREFVAEMETLGKIKHRNLVPLLGYCKVGEERLLVYEFMEGGSLEEALHGGGGGFGGGEGGAAEKALAMSWERRKQAARGAARGLAFLHHNCIPHIIHRDMKSSNVLLGADMEARVSDFGMARLISALDTHLSVSTLAGTPGYVPPEYYQSFRCTSKGDVYSFGVVLLELVTGRRATDCAAENNGAGSGAGAGAGQNLVGWVKLKVSQGRWMEVIDPALLTMGGGDGVGVREEEMRQYLELSCQCLDDAPARRPSMLRVVALLNSTTPDPPIQIQSPKP